MSEFIKSLAAAQAEMGNAAFNRVNPHFKSKYADFAAVREATLPILTKHGFAIIQTIDHATGGGEVMTLKTELAHASGECRFSYYPIQYGTPQQMGSALTYARRYSWSAITGIASEDDDDGHAASQSSGKPKTAHQARKDGDYPKIEAEIRACDTVEALKKLGVLMGGRIIEWPDTWKRHIRDEYARRMTELEEGVTEDGNVENG